MQALHGEISVASTDFGSSLTIPSTPAATITSSAPSGERVYYRVRLGGSLSVVAERFDVSLDELVGLNPQIDPNALKVGQRLRIH